VVHMAFHFAETPTNELISSRPETLDPVTGTPAYKTCPVKVSKCPPENNAAAMVSVLYRASQDSTFTSQIARDPAAALKEYKLKEEERGAIASGDVKKIEALTGRLDERLKIWLIARQPQEKH
jgi:hypothetical protein